MMNKILKKISLLLIICSLITPSYFVGATGDDTQNNQTESKQESSENSEASTTTGGNTSDSNDDDNSKVETEVSKNDDATLKTLKADGIEFKEAVVLDKTFKYTAVVGYDVESTNITATPNNPLSKIADGSKQGLQQLVVGDNEFKIKVTAESGKELEYTVVITRATNDLKLTKLNIQGQKLNEIFDPENTEYTADVTYNVKSIVVQHGKPKNTTVTVTGNSNLKVGKNTVTITVKNASGDSNVYKIIVTRSDEENIEEDDEKEESTTSEDVIVSEITSDDNNKTSTEASVVVDEKSESNTLRSVIIITSSILLLLIAGLGIYFYVRTGNSEAKKQKKIDKLKKKQAKIEQQLTGLMPVITEDLEEEYLKKEKKQEKNKEVEENIEDEEEFEDTIEINIDEFEEDEEEEIVEPKRRRVDKTIFDEDIDDLFDDRDL